MQVSTVEQLLNSTAGHSIDAEQHEYVAMRIAELIDINGAASTMRDFKKIMNKAQAHFVRKRCEAKKYNRKKVAAELRMSYRALLYHLKSLEASGTL